MPVQIETPSQIDGFDSCQKRSFMRVLMEPPSISVKLVMTYVFNTLLMPTIFLGFVHNSNSRHFCIVLPEFISQLHHVMIFALAPGRDGNPPLKVCH